MGNFRTFPPYGANLASLAKQGRTPPNDIFIFLGKSAWQKAREFSRIHWATLLPQNTSPNEYRWDFVCGHSVLIFDTSGVGCEIVRHLAYELLKARASIVRAVVANYKKLVVFRRG